MPVFYNVPKRAADRAIEKFAHRHDLDDGADVAAVDEAAEPGGTLQAYMYDEIREEDVMYVDSESLEEYVAGRVESLTIEPDE